MHIFLEGGFPMFLALAAGLLGLAVCLAQGVLLRRVDLTPLVVCSTLATVLVGAFGFTYGLYWGLHATVQQDPSALAMPLARGISMAVNSATLALGLAGLQAVLGGGLVTARHLLGRRGAQPAQEVTP